MPQSSKISKLLTQLLFKNPGVFIPGIGSFRIETITQANDPNQHIFSGPFTVLRFYEDRQPKDVDIIVGALNQGFIKDKSVDKWTKLIEDKINELLNLGSTEITDFAVITKNKHNDLIISQAISPLFTPRKFLPDVVLSPLPEVSEVEANAIPIIETSSKIEPKTEFKTTIQLAPERKVVEEASNSSDWLKTYLMPLLILVIGTALMITLLKTCFGEKPDNLPPQIKKSIGNVINSGDTPEIARDSAVVIRDYKELLTPAILANGCEIVIGSYSEMNNAVARQKRSDKEGFPAQIVGNGGGYRVVVAFDCEAIDMIAHYNNIRSKVASDAWFLVPKDFDPKQWQLKNQ